MWKKNMSSLDFAKIVEILGIEEKIPVYYTARENLNSENYVFFHIIGDAGNIIGEAEDGMKNIYSEDGRHDSEVGIYLPDVDVYEYSDMEEKRNPIVSTMVMDHIGELIGMMYLQEMPIVRAVYSVLHEVGHWVDFINSGKTPWEYAVKEREERKDLNQMAVCIKQLPDIDPRKYMLEKDYHKKYRELPSESAADQYADKHLVEALGKIRVACGYTEEDLQKMMFEE